MSVFLFEALCITSSQPLRQTIVGFAGILEVDLRTAAVRFAFVCALGLAQFRVAA